MIEMRALKLIESKCDRLALNFISEALRVIRMCTDDHLLRQTVSCRQHLNLLELYFSLLYKFKESSRLKTELESMEIVSVKEFILNSFYSIDAYLANQKLQPKKGHTVTCAGRLHKYHVSVSQYALQLILVRFLSGQYGTDGLGTVFEHLLTEWIRRNESRTDFHDLFQKIIQTAASNSQIYECCEIIFKRVMIHSKII